VIHAVFSYAAQLVVLERESGRIDKVVAVHDVGRAVNPLLCEARSKGLCTWASATLCPRNSPVTTRGDHGT